VTAPVGRVVEGLDLERILVGEALGLSLSPTRSRLLEWYGTQGASGETLGEIMATNPPYEAAMAPQTLFHRFIIEDIPFGLVPMEEFGHSLNIPTPIASSLITLSNELLGRDLRKEGRNMQRLGIAGLSPQELKAMINGHVS
jgi:opine dehydrogenase